jgi:hypothetical protein
MGDEMHGYLKVWAALSIGLLAPLSGNAQPLGADHPDQPNPVTAIDIVLDPDVTMIRQAQTANASLRKSFPEGFAVDDLSPAYLTCLQRFVRTADLDKVYEAVGRVLADRKPTAWKLNATKLDYVPWKDLGLARIVVESNDDLIKFQKRLIDAVAPFIEPTGDAAAFVMTAEDPDVTQQTIDYVTNFVPNGTGKKFDPHVTIGLASPDYLNEMLDERFEIFRFSLVGVSVYQLDNFGMARMQLKSWKLKR